MPDQQPPDATRLTHKRQVTRAVLVSTLIVGGCGSDSNSADGIEGGTTGASTASSGARTTEETTPSSGPTTGSATPADGSGTEATESTAAPETDDGRAPEECAPASPTTPPSGPVDDAIAAMPPDSWLALDNTWMRDVCPDPYNAYFCGSVIDAWSGAAYDHTRDRMLVYGGGHGDSYYNNIFAFDLAQMSWSRLTELPVGADGSSPTEAMRYVALEPCALYPKVPYEVPERWLNPNYTIYIDYEHCDEPEIVDILDYQQPRSSHTYNKNIYDAENDQFCYLGGSYYPGAQTSPPRVICYQFGCGEWRFVADRPDGSIGRGASAVDTNGDVWVVGSGNSGFVRYDVRADSWEAFGNTNGLNGTADIDTARNQLVQLDGSPDNIMRSFDLNAPSSVFTEIPVPANIPVLGPRPGFVYAPMHDRFVAWSGERRIYVWDPEDWTATVYNPDGDDPGETAQWGTYGRFRYSPHRNVFVLVNDVEENVFIYKPPAQL
ncbi:MAG: hypothetical protein JKY37_02165 [Nannocystaceae bacterium]|nr:hypothetical protein [Nannocystaceae bacterium]